jgi:hypothetical protein
MKVYPERTSLDSYLIPYWIYRIKTDRCRFCVCRTRNYQNIDSRQSIRRRIRLLKSKICLITNYPIKPIKTIRSIRTYQHSLTLKMMQNRYYRRTYRYLRFYRLQALLMVTSRCSEILFYPNLQLMKIRLILVSLSYNKN